MKRQNRNIHPFSFMKIPGTAMKKLVLLMLGIFILMLPAGCRREAKYKIGISQCSYDDWRLKLNEELERQAYLYPEIELDIRSAYDDPQRQINDIRNFIEEGVDVIITSPQNSENLNEVLEEARGKGITVIAFDRLPSKKCYDTFVTADNDKLGRAAADFLLHQKGSGSRILELKGAEGSSPAAGRARGFREVLEATPGATLLASVNADWNRQRAEALADSLLLLYPETNVIYAHNDRMAIGARNATRKAGRPDILIAGIDAVPEVGMKAVADGEIDATFIYPTAGAELLDLARKAIEGEELQNMFIMSSARPVTAENADIMLEINRSISDEKAKVDILHEQVDRYSTRHFEQRVLLIAILAIVVLLAIVIFTLMRAYWQRKRSQEILADRNSQLTEQRDQLSKLNSQLTERSDELTRLNTTLTEQRDELTRLNTTLTEQRDELSQLNIKLKEATQAKLVFFTNVSHDLRTPLTLIAEPISQLRGASNLTGQQDVLVKLADKNVRILQRLINQILDFRKFENGKLRLLPSELDLKRCFGEWSESFIELARRRHIRFNMEFGTLSSPSASLDPEKMERIFFNLMSNAFKFTPENGRIKAHVSLADGRFLLEVEDSGTGMDQETIAHVFERFYQADKVEPKGSGIGLALVKAFANLHDGDVSVESTPGKGTIFRVEIPERHLEQEAVVPLPLMNSGNISTELEEIPNPDPSEIDESKPCVLVIDDTPDIRTLVRTLLGDRYTVIEAGGGKQGIRLASRYIPDLIICDVMMPDLNGMECCRLLKEEMTTSHIPILMLTACSLDEQQAQGFESGADGYLSKPFNSDVLLAHCASLIANRRLLSGAKRELDQPTTPKGSPSGPTSDTGQIPSRKPTLNDHLHPTQEADTASARVKKGGTTPELAIESEFYQRFLKIVDEELANADISVEEIGARLGLSRVQFYRKIKALTNYSPNEILRIRRLKEAYRRLASSEDTVGEIAYSVGFSTPSYFAKCFKEYFGILPADLQKRTSKMS